MTAYDWIIALAFTFAIGIVLALYLEKDIFFGVISFSLIGAGFITWSGLLESWILILIILLDLVFIYIRRTKTNEQIS